MGKFHQFLTELSAKDTSVFSLMDNFSKYQWMFTKLGLCIDIVEIYFEIANGQISSISDNYLPAIHLYFLLSGHLNRFSSNLICAFILLRSALGLLIGKFGQF